MNHIQTTKRRITLTFFIAIVFIILLLGISFFTFRFFESIHRDRLEKDVIFSNQIPTPSFQRDGKEYKKGERGKSDRRVRGPFMVQFDSEGNIIHKDFSAQNEREEFIEQLYQFKDTESFQLEMGNGRFITSPDGTKTLLFSPARYPLHEYLEDIGKFLLFALLFFLPLYFIIKYFVDRTIRPVEENLRDMEDFVHNAGHELKTPLSVIHGDLQMLQTKKEYSELFVNEMIGEIDKLNRLIEGLVDMTNIHSTSDVETIKVHSEIQHISKTFEHLMHQKNITFEIHPYHDLYVQANKGYFQIFIGNLISNAVKYNKEGGNVIVHIHKKSFSIEDTGEGISEEHHSKVWQRFYKVQKGESSGSGIGLSLVKKIAEIYSWKIKIESKKGQFARFIVSVH